MGIMKTNRNRSKMNYYQSITLALIAAGASAQQYTYGNACGNLTD